MSKGGEAPFDAFNHVVATYKNVEHNYPWWYIHKQRLCPARCGICGRLCCVLSTVMRVAGVRNGAGRRAFVFVCVALY